MDAAGEVKIEILPLIRVYKDGRIERLIGTDVVSPSVDPVTGVSSKDVVIQHETGVMARLYLPDLAALNPNKKLPVLVYYHGGGFCIESAASPTYHNYLNTLVARAGILAVSVNYRLAPEHPIPAAYDDAWHALQWVASGGDGAEEWLMGHADMQRVFLAGDSAGANIAHHVTMRVGEAGLARGARVEGVLLVHPYFWGPRVGPDVEEEEKTFLSASSMDMVWPFVCPGAKSGEEDPRLNPVAEGAASLAGLRCGRVLVAVAARDVLRERGRTYYEGLGGSGWGGEAELLESEGEDHVFHLFKPESEKALEMMERMVAFFKC